MPRPRVHDDELRQRLIQRAATVLASEGERALTLRSLATAEGTSTSAVYSLFGDKENLVNAVIDSAREGFVAAQQSVAPTDDALQDLSGLGLAYRAWAVQNPGLYWVMFSSPPVGVCDGPQQSEPDPTLQPLLDAVRRLLVQSHGARLGIGSEELEGRIRMVAQSLWAGVHGMVTLELSGRLPGGQDLFRAHAAALAEGWTRQA